MEKARFAVVALMLTSFNSNIIYLVIIDIAQKPRFQLF